MRNSVEYFIFPPFNCAIFLFSEFIDNEFYGRNHTTYTPRKKVLSRTLKGSSAQRSAGTFKGSR